jgi:hypothetical protein
MATVAVFIALGGTGYAVSGLAKNSVKAKQIAPNAVRASEVKADAIGTSEVADGSLQSGDFGADQLPAGPRGPAGQDGAQGPPGPTYASTSNESDPVATPDIPNIESHTFTTPAAGKLLVTFVANTAGFGGTGGVRVGCSNGMPNVGLSIDDIPIPDTVTPLSNNTYEAFTVTGVTASSLPAGPHTLRLIGDCPGGNAMVSSVSSNSNLSAVLLGG